MSIRNKVTIALIILVAALSATAQAPAEPEVKEIPLTNARINFDETTYDFGSIAKGSMVTHNYWFTNAGSDTLVVTKITPTCGCTTTRQAGFTVPPSEGASIDIVFDSGKFNGRVTKSIKVETNDSLNPYLELRFKAVINNPLQILEYSPLKVDFENTPPGTQRQFSIMLTNVDTTESEVVIVEKPDDQFIQTQVMKSKLGPDDSTELVFTLSKGLEPGPFITSVSIETKDKPNSRITIPISGSITP